MFCIYNAYIANLEVLPHQEVQRSRGLGTDAVHTGAAVFQQTQAQISALFSFFIKQQIWKL
jgi:hypothetical protein